MDISSAVQVGWKVDLQHPIKYYRFHMKLSKKLMDIMNLEPDLRSAADTDMVKVSFTDAYLVL